jgi:hypothetical protein
MIKTISIQNHPRGIKQVRFGRNRPRVVHPHLRFANYIRTALPTPPASCDFSSPALPALRNIYCNDQLGCCVISGANHVQGTETGNAGDLVVATDQIIINEYSKIGGYVPGDPSTDNGCDLQTALAYYSQTGFANGTKLLGYLAVDPTNQQEVMQACWLFENLYHAFELNDAWISPFPSADGFVWDDGAPDPNNGHCVMSYGFDATGVKIDTWGLFGTVTWKALAHLGSSAGGGELWIMLTPDQLTKGQTKAPNGVAWSDLISDFDAMGGTVPQPTPAPPSPTPPTPPSPPTPGAPVTLAQAQAWVVAALKSAHPLLTRSQAENIASQGLAASWTGPTS